MASTDNSILIVSAARTPVGSFNGALSSLAASELGTVAIKAAMDRARVEPSEVKEVIMGQILTAAQGQNPARQASIHAGIPVDAPACVRLPLVPSRLPTVLPISSLPAARNR